MQFSYLLHHFHHLFFSFLLSPVAQWTMKQHESKILLLAMLSAKQRWSRHKKEIKNEYLFFRETQHSSLFFRCNSFCFIRAFCEFGTLSTDHNSQRIPATIVVVFFLLWFGPSINIFVAYSCVLYLQHRKLVSYLFACNLKIYNYETHEFTTTSMWKRRRIEWFVYRYVALMRYNLNCGASTIKGWDQGMSYAMHFSWKVFESIWSLVCCFGPTRTHAFARNWNYRNTQRVTKNGVFIFSTSNCANGKATTLKSIAGNRMFCFVAQEILAPRKKSEKLTEHVERNASR